ncbi:helix-turn-helix DNA binding domain protein [Arthrobacter phage Grekaycon]|uniref:Helix-turn-helix DNA binding domain protein n=3 Tax=Marthavirus martha TaxID=1980950 RepID=A0A514A5I1_9CAUD|nr:HTH DNA binding protein [Arthrobacter phage Martha]ALY09691.1 helix-turn-helix DNA binding domain protein [Arthrobacter phage Martha]ALY10495.1 helix-turn-helix DNA binding domain protein [Arthrobacter phage TaeYoung]KUR65814.1 hypothetical protein JM67_03420 [Arthrobacter sp. ATCC 21022]QDH48528.1 helix-turn-helix DNA binding domain protein [Arthrobacter phage Grekaycon]
MSTEHLPAGEQAPEDDEFVGQLAEVYRESREAREHFVQAVLSAKERNMSNVQIAKHLGVTEGAVRGILRRAGK